MIKTALLGCTALILGIALTSGNSTSAKASTQPELTKSFKVESAVEREGSSGGKRQRRGGERLIDDAKYMTVSLNKTDTDSIPSRHGRGRDDAPGDDHRGTRGGK